MGGRAGGYDGGEMTGGGRSGRERYGAGRIVVSDHDPAWAAMYERERARVQDLLGPIVVAVEHVGSTAVPGLAAKPIIDLLVGVRSLPEARACCIQPLEADGYRYMAEYETWLPGEMLFRKGPPGPWTHHVHLMEPTSPRWEEFTLIRDYLRRHREVAGAYADLKRALALVFGDDIAGYRNAKAPFIEALMARARAER
jgi:GrpB-like predicted nucleotidyltransferase (UPF0157 family)